MKRALAGPGFAWASWYRGGVWAVDVSGFVHTNVTFGSWACSAPEDTQFMWSAEGVVVFGRETIANGRQRTYSRARLDHGSQRDRKKLKT